MRPVCGAEVRSRHLPLPDGVIRAAILFVTARPGIIEPVTALNLNAVGYRWTDI